MNNPLPPALHAKFGHLRFILQRGRTEWSAECPVCRDYGHTGKEYPDRFRMFNDKSAAGWCRKCGVHIWAKDGTPGFRPDPAVAAEFRARQLESEQRRKIEAERAIKLLQDEHLWERWHSEMPDTARAWWRSQGISEFWQDYLRLGYCPDKPVWSDGHEFHTATYTLPVWDTGWKLVNLRHRLVNEPRPGDKYRPDRAGLPASLYLTDPENPIAEHVLAVEGEKKAIVTCATLDVGGGKASVVGFPGKNPSTEILERLDHCQRVVICLDPDVDTKPIASRYGNRARLMTLPGKIDDCILQGMTKRELRQHIRQALPV